MLKNKHQHSSTSAFIGSVVLHLGLLFFATVPMFFSDESKNLLMDIEIAGEGAFSEEHIHQFNEEEKIVPQENKPKPHEESKQIPVLIEEKVIPEINDKQDANNDNLDIEGESVIKNEEEESQKDIPEEIEEEDNSIKPEEKPLEEKKIVKKTQEKKKVKKKKTFRKAIMDVIKKSDKKNTIKTYKQNKSDLDFDKMLSKTKDDLGKLKTSSGKGKKGSGTGSFGKGNGATENDHKMISSQIIPNWIVPSGVRDAENIIIEIHIEVRDNGEIIPSSIKVIDEKRYATDYVFRAAVDSAKRAILESSPLNIPREKMKIFRSFTFSFNLKEALER